jgi:hypothetical protein
MIKREWDGRVYRTLGGKRKSLLTAWKRILLKKLLVPHLVKETPSILWNLETHYLVEEAMPFYLS